MAACSPATFEFLALIPRFSVAKGGYLRMKFHARLVECLQGFSSLALSLLWACKNVVHLEILQEATLDEAAGKAESCPSLPLTPPRPGLDTDIGRRHLREVMS